MCSLILSVGCFFFKLFLTFKCLRTEAPAYLCEMLSSVTTVEALQRTRSAARRDLLVPRTKPVRYGQRSFAVAAPVLWNSLPTELRVLGLSLAVFKSKLK